MKLITLKFQLTTLHSLQSSLDILRSHRPDFTPRTGFVWPIVEPQTGDNSSKRRNAEDTSVEGENVSSASIKAGYPARSTTTTKKQENNLPLFNAMRTTVAHSVISFAQRTAEEGVQEILQESSVSSGTPGPVREETPSRAGVHTSVLTQDNTSRSALAVGKKKKKSWSRLYILHGMTTNRAEQIPYF